VEYALRRALFEGLRHLLFGVQGECDPLRIRDAGVEVLDDVVAVLGVVYVDGVDPPPAFAEDLDVSYA